MKRNGIALTALLWILLAVSCTRNTPAPVVTTDVPSTHTLGPVSTQITRAPDARNAASDYLEAWRNEDYPSMYNLLTQVSKDAIKLDDFQARYSSVANAAALRQATSEEKGVTYEILSALTSPQSAQVRYRVTLHSVLVGDISRETNMNLSLEAGEWRVQWDDSLILPELKNGNMLRMEYRVPSRANIYDRNGHALVAQADAVSLGIDTSKVSEEQVNSLLDVLYDVTGIRQESLRDELENYMSHGWYLPVGDISTDVYSKREGALDSFGSVIAQAFRTRYYFGRGRVSIAPQVTGFMSLIQPDEVEKYRRLGYDQSERVGRSGLEIWGEPYLAGKRGGALYVVSPDGKTVISKLAESASLPSQAIYTTVDRDFQIGVQQAISDYHGAVVVLERDTGRVLAMASSPSYDANLFEPSNYNYQFLINKLYAADSGNPMLNRATQGQYPLGSVFKIITMSAALESGLYPADYTYECGYHFEELFGVTLNDWTWEHYLKDGKTQPSGTLTLPEGLMRSCNPFFMHIGLGLWNQDQKTAITNMALKFGLGTYTGIEIEEEKGQVPAPQSQIDATNQSVGQGALLVTPLQVADFIAAVGNGGTLYRPTLVERIAPPDGSPTMVFTPTVLGKLPISPENLAVVQQAMVSVIENPHGTAHNVFVNFQINIAGKTGTAQDTPRDSHAWFAGYTYDNRKDKPDIAVVVIAENAGEGSEIAAPIFRRVLELYFYGKANRIYPWESSIGVLKTPTPTPGPQGEETPTPSP